jgi:cellulose synthase/poly-beta-1,6-N-acetylglucosamine synthase-like glycosyltransferase
VRKEYDEIKKLYANIQTLKKGKPIFDDLPNKLRPFFMNEAREQRKKEYSMSDDEVKQLSDDRLIEEYASDVRRAKPLIIKCLQEGERYCTEYVSSREDLAYLGCFRHKIKLNYQGALCHKEKRHRNKEYTDIYTNEVFVEEVVEGPPPTSFMNLFMCIKYKNSGKLSSHNWFFNGFCKELKPRFAVLLDVGLRPD